MVLRRVGVGSAFRIVGAIYAVLGLLFGALFACFALLGAGIARATGDGNGPPALFGALFGIGAIFFLPVMYGLLGAIMAAFTAWLYNTFARLTGGLELDLE